MASFSFVRVISCGKLSGFLLSRRAFFLGIFFLWTLTGQARYKVELMDRIPLVPQPKTLVYSHEKMPFPQGISIFGLSGENDGQLKTMETLTSLFERMPDVHFRFGGGYPFRITFTVDAGIANPEGYELAIGKKGVMIRSATDAGAFYAAQTLYQILAFSYYGCEQLFLPYEPLEEDAAEKKYIPLLEIRDEPQYMNRSVMLDMGRSTFPVPYIRRIIRIMAQLKLNMLHLHLYDDELSGFRFSKIPVGRENPYAINGDDLKGIVQYARSYHITVMPELESWGHVQSIVNYYPALKGGPGMYGGASFAIGEKTFHLLGEMYEEIISCMEDSVNIHVGLDEAIWKVMPGEEDRGYTPSKMVGKIYDILMGIGEKYHKRITMHLWADHGGRPLPASIKDKVVIEPWEYKKAGEKGIVKKMKKYGGAGKTPLMMGAGISWTCMDGDYGATAVWCREGTKYPNVLGATICIWGSNDIAGRLITLYGGADYLWSPSTPEDLPDDPYGEKLRALIGQNMRKWQSVFPGAAPAALDRDRGPEVSLGKYVWPPMAGKPVAGQIEK